jgi:hypothetical protein
MDFLKHDSQISTLKKVTSLLKTTDGKVTVDCSTFNFILQRLKNSNCMHIIDSIISHLDEGSFRHLSETNSFHKNIINNFLQNIVQKQRQLWLDRDNNPIVSIKDIDLYFNPEFSTNFPASKNENTRRISFKKLASDCTVTWLDTPHRYIVTESNTYLKRSVVAVRRVFWLYLEAVFAIEIGILKNLLHESNGVLSLQGGWRIMDGHLSHSRTRSRDFPQIKISCSGKSSEQNFFRTEAEKLAYSDEKSSEPYLDDIFRKSEHFNQFAKSPSIFISMSDILQAENAGNSKICVTLEYNDTVDKEWKDGLKWSYAEIIVGGNNRTDSTQFL